MTKISFCIIVGKPFLENIKILIQPFLIFFFYAPSSYKVISDKLIIQNKIVYKIKCSMYPNCTKEKHKKHAKQKITKGNTEFTKKEKPWKLKDISKELHEVCICFTCVEIT